MERPKTKKGHFMKSLSWVSQSDSPFVTLRDRDSKSQIGGKNWSRRWVALVEFRWCRPPKRFKVSTGKIPWHIELWNLRRVSYLCKLVLTLSHSVRVCVSSFLLISLYEILTSTDHTSRMCDEDQRSNRFWDPKKSSLSRGSDRRVQKPITENSHLSKPLTVNV